jgi:hypothetical protein
MLVLFPSTCHMSLELDKFIILSGQRGLWFHNLSRVEDYVLQEKVPILTMFSSMFPSPQCSHCVPYNVHIIVYSVPAKLEPLLLVHLTH